MTYPDVMVVASWNVDLVTRIPAPLQRGQTQHGEGLQRLAGGKGSNAAVACARQGARTGLVAAIGDDGFGDMGLALWQQEQIDARHARRLPGQPNGTALILVYDDGDNSIVVVPGANAGLAPEHVQAAQAELAGARWVMASCEVPLAAVQTAFALARAGGARTLLNPAPAMPLPDALWPLIDVLTPNEGELAQLSGCAQADEGAARLLARGVGALVVTLGAAGYRLYRPGQAPLSVPGHRMAVVDSVGAGDTFIGALTAALARQQDWPQALATANAAAALSTLARGALGGMPTLAQTQAFLAGTPPQTLTSDTGA